MKISFLTFNTGHLVSDREFDKLRIGFAKEEMELVRGYENDCDIVMVKGFSHRWEEIMGYSQPKVYFSIGTEWKEWIDILEANEPIYGLYANCDAVVHNSSYCKRISEEVFGPRPNQFVIIPANEPNLPSKQKKPHEPFRFVSTAIWRPIKRGDQLRDLFEKLKKNGYKVKLDMYGTPEGPMLDEFSCYHEYDAYIQVSRKEGMPNTVLEALAHGLPCIVTNHGGAKEAVGLAGIVVHNDPPDSVKPDLQNIPPLDYQMFENAVETMMTSYDEYAEEVRRRVTEELNDRICAQTFKKVFNLCLNPL